MSDFLFDQDLVDKQHRIKISVTRCDADDDDVQIRITNATQFYPGPEVHFFIALATARDLGSALLVAADEQEPEPDPDLLREQQEENRSLLKAWSSIDTAVGHDGEE